MNRINLIVTKLQFFKVKVMASILFVMISMQLDAVLTFFQVRSIFVAVAEMKMDDCVFGIL